MEKKNHTNRKNYQRQWKHLQIPTCSTKTDKGKNKLNLITKSSVKNTRWEKGEKLEVQWSIQLCRYSKQNPFSSKLFPVHRSFAISIIELSGLFWFFSYNRINIWWNMIELTDLISSFSWTLEWDVVKSRGKLSCFFCKDFLMISHGLIIDFIRMWDVDNLLNKQTFPC